MPSRVYASRQDGFTIIEVMVAAMLLLVGMLGLLSMVDRADQATAATRAREGATNLAREVVEQARAVPYNQITQAGLAARIQADAPGLASTSGGGAWTVRRRNFTFTITTSVCAIDDPRDGLGDHSAGGFCAGPSGTDDGGPQDFKQVRATVGWTVGGAAKSVTSTSLITTHGTADAAVARNLVAVTPTFADPGRPLLTSTSVTSVTFETEASSTATRVIWSVDGIDKGNATKVGSKWQFTLAIPSSTTAMTDGDYEIGARAVDITGAEGPTLSIPLRLLRTVPSAPTNVVIGNNRVRDAGTLKDAVELEWQLNPERNVRGYRVYRGNDTLACPTDPSAVDKRPSCVDVAPSYGTYKIRALYENAGGVIVESPNAATASVGAPNWDPRTLYLHGPQLTSTGSSPMPTNCPPNGTVFQMSQSFAGETDISSLLGGNALRFCATTTEPTARTYYNGELRATVWARNTHASSTCSVTALMGFNSDSTKSVSASASVPPNSYGPITWSSTYANIAVAAGDRPVLALTNSGATSSCNSTTFIFAGTGTRSLMYAPAPNELPRAPTGLTATPTSSGLRLDWTAPSAATADWFYRIYRVGTDYTQRYDRTSSSGTTFTVPDSNGAQQYWVTAVTPRLSESPVSNAVTG